MRTLMLLGLIIAGLFVAGAIHVQQRGNTIDVTVDEDRIKAVAKQVVAEEQAVLKHATVKGTTQAR